MHVQSDARPQYHPWGERGPRPRGLLVTEIQGLENLLAATSKRAADRPALLRRVMEDYRELEESAEREFAAAAAGVASEVARVQRHANAQVAIAARGKVIDRAMALEKDYPDYPQRDEVMLALADALDRAGNGARADAIDRVILSDYPGSRVAPFAELSLADRAFDDASLGASSWDRVEAAYRAVLAYEAPRNRAYGYASYKLGWALEHQGHHEDAVTAMNSAAAFAGESDAPDLAKLAEVARADASALDAPKPLIWSP